MLNNNKFSEDWNPLNVLVSNAATVGNLDLDLIDQKNEMIKNLNQNKFDLVFPLGQDNLKFEKKNYWLLINF